ncbi:MAG: TIGR03085 family metal-binding protein [Nostocoides sp.]
MAHLAQTERVALADLAATLDPHAPTLCEGWDIADLLAHIILRDSRPDLAVGLMVPALADRLARAQTQLAATAFTALVERVRTGPPAWHPSRIGAVDEAVNLIEFFVHHEDIRRANGMGPRPADPPLDRALATWLKRTGRLWFRRAEVGVTIAPRDAAAYDVHGDTEQGRVTIAGRVEEIMLYAYGRRSVADVELLGDPTAVQALARSPLGL